MNRDNNAVNDDVLFDDWATRDPAIYARVRRASAFAVVLAGVLSLIAVIASFFFVYLLIVVLLIAPGFFGFLYEFLRFKNGHLKVYKDKIVIPTTATVQIQDKFKVYLVDKDNIAHEQLVVTEPLSNGKEYVIKDGLKVGDVIVAEGAGMLKDGQDIKPNKENEE